MKVHDRVGAMAPFAAEHGARLVRQPLHPTFAAERYARLVEPYL